MLIYTSIWMTNKHIFKLWSWDPQTNFNIHPSPSFTAFPRNLKGQSHFLLSLLVTCKFFLFWLYLPYFSQPNNMYAFILRWPFEVSDLNITTYTTFLAHLKNSSRLGNYLQNIIKISYLIYQIIHNLNIFSTFIFNLSIENKSLYSFVLHSLSNVLQNIDCSIST